MLRVHPECGASADRTPKGRVERGSVARFWWSPISDRHPDLDDKAFRAACYAVAGQVAARCAAQLRALKTRSKE